MDGLPSATGRLADDGGIGVVGGPGIAELGEFVVVGVGLAFGALRPGPQVGAQLVAVVGSVSAEASQPASLYAASAQRLAVLGPGDFSGGLGAGGVLLCSHAACSAYPVTRGRRWPTDLPPPGPAR